MKITKATPQTVAQKWAEVNFREKISQQHLGQKVHFRDELNHQEMLIELRKRIKNTQKDFELLVSLAVNFSPFLEIGAEYCVRAALLQQRSSQRGFALDISAAPLQSAPQFIKQLGFSRLPTRICADAYHLPFANNSFSFVFCYQTLHHFPNPSPIISEIHRVLAPGGYFFFAEEPIEQQLNLKLFRRPTKTQGWYKFLKYFLILPFISEIGKTEVNYGILENSFSINIWEEALTKFKKIEATISPAFVSIPKTFTKNQHTYFIKPTFIQTILISFLGGGLRVVAQKAGQSKKVHVLLVCPQCQGKLTRVQNTYYCHKQHLYKRVNGVLFCLPYKLKQELYPHI